MKLVTPHQLVLHGFNLAVLLVIETNHLFAFTKRSLNLLFPCFVINEQLANLVHHTLIVTPSVFED